jgi:hypothetical protein
MFNPCSKECRLALELDEAAMRRRGSCQGNILVMTESRLQQLVEPEVGRPPTKGIHDSLPLSSHDLASTFKAASVLCSMTDSDFSVCNSNTINGLHNS